MTDHLQDIARQVLENAVGETPEDVLGRFINTAASKGKGKTANHLKRVLTRRSNTFDEDKLGPLKDLVGYSEAIEAARKICKCADG